MKEYKIIRVINENGVAKYQIHYFIDGEIELSEAYYGDVRYGYLLNNDLPINSDLTGATAQELKEIAVNEIKAKYELHKINGWKAYQDFRATVVLDIASGKITETQAFIIEKDLKIGYDRIAQNGDWKTAYYELSQVVISYPFVQEYMDLALNYIAVYIQTNYDS